MTTTFMLDGMRRKVWSTGHVVIPEAMRDAHGIHPGDAVTFAALDGAIVIRKAEPHASFAAPRPTRGERTP